MTDTANTQLFDLWRRSLEESTQAWTKLVSQTPAPAGDPFAVWRPVLDQHLEAWARMFAQTPASPDVLNQWKQFLDQWIEAWSRVLGQTMSTESFAEWMGRSLDQWLAMQAPARRAAEQATEQALQTLNVASGTQLTNVARQIVDLEERLERVEDGVQAIGRQLARLDEGMRALLARLAETARP